LCNMYLYTNFIFCFRVIDFIADYNSVCSGRKSHVALQLYFQHIIKRYLWTAYAIIVQQRSCVRCIVWT